MNKEQRAKVRELEETIDKALAKGVGDEVLGDPVDGVRIIGDGFRIIGCSPKVRIKLGGYHLPDEAVMDELTRRFQKKGKKQLRFVSSHVYGTWVEPS